MSRRQLLKLMDELDAFDFKLEQRELKRLQLELELHRQQHDLLALWFDMYKAAKHLAISSEENQSHESKEVDSNLPAIFDDYGEEERKEDIQDTLEETQEEVMVEADEGEILLLEPTWNESDEEQDEQEHHYKSTNQSELCSLSLDGENRATQVSLDNTNLHTFDSYYLEPQKPRMKPPHVQDQSEWCPPTHHIPIPQKHPSRTKQALFAWLILFQPLTLFTPTVPLLSFFFHSQATHKKNSVIRISRKNLCLSF